MTPSPHDARRAVGHNGRSAVPPGPWRGDPILVALPDRPDQPYRVYRNYGNALLEAKARDLWQAQVRLAESWHRAGAHESAERYARRVLDLCADSHHGARELINGPCE